MLFTLLSFVFALVNLSAAKTITYNWDITFITANPDGRLARPVICVNGQWPNPPIIGDVGDKVVVNVNNKLPNETTSLHWHGLYQQDNNAQDGPPMVTQCPILPGQSYTYKFTLGQPGTYWYHSHSPVQYGDGLRGPIIIRDPAAPFAHQYDGEIVMTISDWYHEQTPILAPIYLSPVENPDGSEPVPYSALMNDEIRPQFPVQAGKTYLLHIINMAAFSQAFFHIDEHDMIIVEADGIYTTPTTSTDLYLATAQRMSVLVKMKPTTSKNFAVLASLDTSKFDNVPSYVQPNVTGVLVYDKAKPLPVEAPVVQNFNPPDEFTLEPFDKMPLLGGKPDASIVLDLDFFERDGQNRGGFNNITYIAQKVPTLYTVLSAGHQADNPLIYGINSNSFVVQHNDLVEIVVNNFDNGAHPFHLHGHAPAMVARGAGTSPASKSKRAIRSAGASPSTVKNDIFGFQPNSTDDSQLRKIPMRRDTWLLAPSSYTTFRFRANNPGVWLLHCHMEWHVEAGLSATLISAPSQIQSKQGAIPPAMAKICKSQGIPTAGNAAGNTKDFLDLTGANTVAPLSKGSLYP